MNPRNLAFAIAVTTIGSISAATSCWAQESDAKAEVASKQQSEINEAMDRVQLFDSLEHPSESSSSARTVAPKPSASELRQARALYRSQQRIARLEHNLWMGYEPLRPNWSAVPMMSSRYSGRRTIYVPVFVRPR
ncbi:MAG: hypothetical protein HKN47_20190 [Pirellulaceae bacterium]|nr:hypothetical protein [Pirellulaceae bacterium]